MEEVLEYIDEYLDKISDEDELEEFAAAITSAVKQKKHDLRHRYPANWLLKFKFKHEYSYKRRDKQVYTYYWIDADGQTLEVEYKIRNGSCSKISLQYKKKLFVYKLNSLRHNSLSLDEVYIAAKGRADFEKSERITILNMLGIRNDDARRLVEL